MKFKDFLSMAKMRLSSKAKSNGVTLGVMPDYGFKGKGVRIDKVTAGKTADKHGLQDGDVVLKIGPHEVQDLMNYMSILLKYSPSDQADVVLLRGEDEIEVNVKF